MKDHTGFFAGLADSLAELCAYYMAAAFILSDRWGLHLGWILLCTAVCSAVQTLFLRKRRMIPLVAAVAAVLFGASLAVFIWKSETPLSVGYVTVLVVGAAMAMGCTMKNALHRPTVFGHLLHLDGMVLALVLMVLCREALEIADTTILCVVAVLLLNAAAAIGIRMTEGAADTENALKASFVALGGAAVLAVLIGLLSAVFSRSGTVTGILLRGLANGLKAIGAAIQQFMEWLVSHVQLQEEFGAAAIGEFAFMSEAEQIAIWKQLSVDPMILAVIAGVLVLVAIVRIVHQLRKHSIAKAAVGGQSVSPGASRKRHNSFSLLWERLRAALRFHRTVLLRRNSPGGLLVYAERRAKRCRRPRKKSESMRSFLCRLDPAGGLNRLADVLDREYYGGEKTLLPVRDCRKARRYIRKVVHHG